MPELNDWDAYMDSPKIAAFGKAGSADFLVNHSFGEEMRRSSTQELCEFRRRCQEFMDRLVEVILSLHLVSAEFYQGIYCFCPELLLEGDDRYIFGLYAKLLRVLKKSGWLTTDVAKASLEEFTSYVVEVRVRHRDSDRSAAEIVDIVAYLLADYSFLCRHNLVRVLKLRRLVAMRLPLKLPVVDIDTSDCSVTDLAVTTALKCVQSYVLSPAYKQIAFFTTATMEAVRDSVAHGRDFLTSVELDPWKELACSDREEFILHYSSLFAGQLCRKKKLAVDQAGDKDKRRQSGGGVASAPSSVRASPVGIAAASGDESTSSSVKADRQKLRASIAAAVANGKKAVTRVGTAADDEGMCHMVPGRMMRRNRKQLALSQEKASSTNYHLLLSLNLVAL